MWQLRSSSVRTTAGAGHSICGLVPFHAQKNRKQEERPPGHQDTTTASTQMSVRLRPLLPTAPAAFLCSRPKQPSRRVQLPSAARPGFCQALRTPGQNPRRDSQATVKSWRAAI